MHINSWPPYLYIPFTLLTALGICFFMVRGRFRNVPMVYTAFGISFIISMVAAAIQKTLRFYLKSFEGIAWIFETTMVITGVLGFIFLFIGAFRYGDKQMKKRAKWVLVLFTVVALFVVYLLLIYRR